MSVAFGQATNACLLNCSIKKDRYPAVVSQNKLMFGNLSFLVPPLALFLFYFISSIWTLHKSRKAFASKNGCKEPRCRVPLIDPFLALDFVWKTLQNAKNFRYLEGTHERSNSTEQTSPQSTCTIPQYILPILQMSKQSFQRDLRTSNSLALESMP
jgi:hypothetical protein